MRLRAVTLLLLLAPLTGCLNDRPAKSASLFDRVRNMGGPTGPDAVFLEYALIERPAGTAAIDREVWANIDEQILPSDTRSLLGENGMRVGVVGGLLPSELETMIANPKSASGHRQRRLYAGNPAALAISGPVTQVDCQVRRTLDGAPSTIKYESAKFAISVTPALAADGRITLKCVPEIEFQDKKNWLPTGATGPGWMGNKPIERCETLTWEATLSPREFLIIGSHHARGAWLGNQIFEGLQGNEKVQRLLIIRAGRLTPAETGWEPSAIIPGKDGVVPIASQASVSAVRGQRP